MARRAAPLGQEFIFRTSPDNIVGVASTIDEFKELVKTLGDASIAYHLRNDRNDFAAWAMESLENKALAKRFGSVKRARNLKSMRERLLSAIKGPPGRRKKG